MQEPMVGETGETGEMGEMGEIDRHNGLETLCEVYGHVGCKDCSSLGCLVVDVVLHPIPTSFLLVSITISRSLNCFKMCSPWQ